MLLKEKIWARILLLNLLLVATLGLLMRYKIAFDFPYFSQRHLQEAHSHFAFSGWVTQSLFVLILLAIWTFITTRHQFWLKTLLVAYLLLAYGQAVSFMISGYSPVTIALIILSIGITGWITCLLVPSLFRLPRGHLSKPWWMVALACGLISYAGPIFIAHARMFGSLEQTSYLLSNYFYLHFQYNGWFSFACLGLWYAWIRKVEPSFRISPAIFWLFTCSVVPTFLLSILWMKLSPALYLLAIAGVVAQTLGWILWIRDALRNEKSWWANLDPLWKKLWLVVGLAVTLKFGLQLISIVPEISKLVFGFRSIVIAYLHLILLLIITVFILSCFWINGLLHRNGMAVNGTRLFVSGIIANEFFLGIQGVLSFTYQTIPMAHQIVFGITLWMFIGALLICISQWQTRIEQNHSVT